MNINISGGAKEDGIVTGNTYDKYGTKNPIAKLMMKGFEKSLFGFINKVQPANIHEIGCGEGYWVLRWQNMGMIARGSDFSGYVIGIARANALERGISESIFEAHSIYDLDESRDSADLIVCCEVLEHLEDPERALKMLQTVVERYLIISVPREPLWCVLNLARGKYWSSWGNTPGHLQRWSKMKFIKLISKYFNIIDVKSPTPWTIILCKPK